jgi:hypothetical protein
MMSTTYRLAEWLQLERDRYTDARPCPACGEPMNYPTRCTDDFEARVFALAGLEPYEADWTRPNLILVNRAMRALDESHLWPIRGRFNVTDRAIGRIAREGYSVDGLDGYVRAVDDMIGRIVNDPSTL